MLTMYINMLREFEQKKDLYETQTREIREDIYISRSEGHIKYMNVVP